METLSKEQILKQARIIEDYQGNESEILGAEKGGKFHGFIAGAEWAIEKLEAEKEKMRELLERMKNSFDTKAWITESQLNSYSKEIESLIQKHKAKTEF